MKNRPINLGCVIKSTSINITISKSREDKISTLNEREILT